MADVKKIATRESYGNALNGVSGYIIELGEKLYSGNLKLIDDRTDDFGRPPASGSTRATTWVPTPRPSC